MTRRKREMTGLSNERDFPHLVELALPTQFLGVEPKLISSSHLRRRRLGSGDLCAISRWPAHWLVGGWARDEDSPCWHPRAHGGHLAVGRRRC
jgi:hypothetical protein